MDRTVTAHVPRKAASGDAWTVRRIIDWTVKYLTRHGSDTPRLDTEILLAHARGCHRIDLYTHFNDVLSDRERAVMRDLVRRRAKAEPVAYLVGFREFFSLEFPVTPDVLIPRPDTETLVVELLELARSLESPRILDVGTGCGCIAVATAVNLLPSHRQMNHIRDAAIPAAEDRAVDAAARTLGPSEDTTDGDVGADDSGQIPPQRHGGEDSAPAKGERTGSPPNITATDIHLPALNLARENAAQHGVESVIRFVHGDLFAPLDAAERFDLIASNPPYVSEREFESLDADVRLHEPRQALAAGPDGLAVLRRLVAEAPNFLTSGGRLLVEIGENQESAVRQLLSDSGAFKDITAIKDLSGHPRVVRAERVEG